MKNGKQGKNLELVLKARQRREKYGVVVAIFYPAQKRTTTIEQYFDRRVAF